MCGGDLDVIEKRELGDPMRLHAIRDAVQFELNAFHFYKLAREQAASPQHRAVLERLYEAELDHLHELSEKYHAHLDASVTEMSPDAEKLLSGLAFPGSGGLGRCQHSAVIPIGAGDGTPHARSFPQAGRGTARGLEKELCQELASEEDEHIAMLETEMEQIG